MIFVDASVFMYAVGRDHPLRAEARDFFARHLDRRHLLVTSAEALQELLHAYLPVQRLATLDAAMTLVDSFIDRIWAVEPDDVHFARTLVDRHPQLGARDLLHLACCIRRQVSEIKTFDRGLAGGFQRA